ncbi:hypothetical protein [Nocardiopsis synnemataformans]|uniref:hypothetical protein n=1 Tax=Nocardiopsis synnemataformans TaxID=61305 RepID=UPI003EBDF1AE
MLVGDAAWCPSLYSGMGASSGLAGANLLGHRLERYGDDVAAALDDWEQTMRPRITEFLEYDKLGIGVFTPKDEKALRVRKRAMTLLNTPVIKSLFARFGRYLPPMQSRERAIV